MSAKERGARASAAMPLSTIGWPSTFTSTGPTENVKSEAFALIFAKCWANGTTKFPAIRRLFALVRLAKNQPEAMLAARVVRDFPLRGHDRPLSDLHDAVTGGEADLGRRFNQLNVRPLEAVPMHIVGNLAEQNALRSQDTIG